MILTLNWLLLKVSKLYKELTEEDLDKFLSEIPKEPKPLVMMYNCLERGMVTYDTSLSSSLCANPKCSWCTNLRETMLKEIKKL